MPTKLFNELPEEKRQRITQAALEEFAANRFDNASTNTIVKNCDISKGSLFKYFENKEDLYFYLVDTVAAKMAQETEDKVKDLPKDVYERIAAYSSLEISYYLEHPTEGKL
ncbi:MAG: TetR/AcrR family transcriptional regulator, partial [Clostridiales bacterium]|nr:TetR/AcrR family transcriptional regulator [Clostridiales bacterium]